MAEPLGGVTVNLTLAVMGGPSLPTTAEKAMSWLAWHGLQLTFRKSPGGRVPQNCQRAFKARKRPAPLGQASTPESRPSTTSRTKAIRAPTRSGTKPGANNPPSVTVAPPPAGMRMVRRVTPASTKSSVPFVRPVTTLLKFGLFEASISTMPPMSVRANEV
jgi:hypothetical protein